MYATQWRSMKELSSVASIRGSSEEFISFQATRAPCNVLNHLQTPPAFSSTKTRLTFEQNDEISNIIPGFSSEFQKKIDPEIVFCQSNHGDNFTNITQLEESFWPIYEDNFNYVQFQGHNMPLYHHFAEYSMLPEENDTDAATVGRLPSISLQRNEDNNDDKHYCRPFEAGGISSSSTNYVHRTSSKGKKRIRWTEELHEPFITIVDRLGGPQKAKPKEILKMMGSDKLTVSHIKSHLQKYRSTLYMQKALQEGHVEKHRGNGIAELQHKIHMQIEESRQLQLEVERSLEEQLEMQRSMQLLIEQQKKQLFIMLNHQKLKDKLEGSLSE